MKDCKMHVVENEVCGGIVEVNTNKCIKCLLAFILYPGAKQLNTVVLFCPVVSDGNVSMLFSGELDSGNYDVVS
jgi:hypothetical protein